MHLPTLHPTVGTSTFSQRVTQGLIGSHRYDTDRIREAFPDLFSEEIPLEPIDVTNPFSIVFNSESVHLVKVIRPRNRYLHSATTRWTNTMFRLKKLRRPFRAHESPAAMAEHEFNVVDELYENGGAVPYPYTWSELSNGDAVIVYEYVPNTGRLTSEKQTLKAFRHMIDTLHTLHEMGEIHGHVNGHIIQTTPDGEPYLVEPIGKTADSEPDQLLGVGYDLATILVSYASTIGTLPALNIVTDYYDDISLAAAYATAPTTHTTVRGGSSWAVSHVQSSIDEVVDPAVGNEFNAIVDTVSEDKTPDTVSLDTVNSSRELLRRALPSAKTSTGTASISTGAEPDEETVEATGHFDQGNSNVKVVDDDDIFVSESRSDRYH